MRFKLSYLILVLSFCAFIHGDVNNSIPQKPHKAVTYQLSSGRFGDQLMNYLHAKWISYKYEIPLLYVAFQYSDQLALHQIETPYSYELYQQFDEAVYPSYGMDIDYMDSSSSIYFIPYFPECMWEHTPQSTWYYFKVDWEDEGFRKIINDVARPLYIKPELDLPEDRITVAVHIRHGGGFDVADLGKIVPLKAPPFSYYKDQIKRLYGLLKNQPMHVHLFTDHLHPPALVALIKKDLKKLDITYSCRMDKNNHHSNVLEDFFEMTRFDCLIRPDSNYSIMAEKIADYKIVISPLSFKKTDNDIVIDEVLTKYSNQ